MKHTTIMMVLFGLLLLPVHGLAQGETGDEDETAGDDEAPADDEAADEEAADEPAADEAAPADEAAGEPPFLPEGEPTTEPAPEGLWSPGEGEQAFEEAEQTEEVEAQADETYEEEPVEVEQEKKKAARKPLDFDTPGTRYRRTLTSFSISIGGGRLALFDEGMRAHSNREQMEYGQWELGLMVLPRLGVSVSAFEVGNNAFTVGGGYDEVTGDSASLSIDPGVAGWEATVRFVPTPPFFPIRGYVRAGGGMYVMHVRVMDYNASGNLRQRDFRGAAGFATVGLGVAIGTPMVTPRRRAVPVSFGLQVEGGARIGGGGTIAAAASGDLGDLGRMDLGPWYFRVAFQTSFWPKPPRAQQ
jgi:hypothetical protein